MNDAKRKLEEEIKKLDRELKDELPKAFKKALEMGDLRENAEYQTAKERQSYVQAQLAALRQRLSKLAMVNLSKIPEGKISYGSTVVILDVDSGKEITYRLVTSEESNAAEGLISTTSPIGRSLLGHEEGDEVKIQTPGGVRTYEIVKLTTIHQDKENEQQE
ncbi:MAG: transcription elongation factor GreA [Acidobacteria bacterium]|nr:MAG: transcription elongation factor GreA [Acidobacteriota bacterium]